MSFRMMLIILPLMLKVFAFRSSDLSSEPSGSAVCENGVLTGLQCLQGNCLKIALNCEDGWTAGTSRQWLELSEAKKGVICPIDKLVTGIRCAGSDCDKMSIQCSETSIVNISNCFPRYPFYPENTFSTLLSKELYIKGFQCSGRNCKKKHFYVCSGKKDIVLCNFPEEKLVPVANCSASSVPIECPYEMETGLSPADRSPDVADRLQKLFSRKIGKSNETGFDWSEKLLHAFLPLSLKQDSFKCPRGHNCSLNQIVGLCGRFTVKTSHVKLETTGKNRMAGCDNLSDKMVTIAKCSANMSSNAVDCKYKMETGLSEVKDGIRIPFPRVDVNKLKEIFSKKLGKSNSTNFDWRNASISLFRPSFWRNDFFKCPAMHECTLKQAVGNCDRKTVKTDFYIVESKKGFGCHSPTDRMINVAKCSARMASVALECHYQTEAGLLKVVNGVEPAIPSDELKHLQNLFSQRLGNSTTTGYDWSSDTDDIFDTATYRNASFNCPSTYDCVLKQVVGECGPYTVKTDYYKLKTTSEKIKGSLIEVFKSVFHYSLTNLFVVGLSLLSLITAISVVGLIVCYCKRKNRRRLSESFSPINIRRPGSIDYSKKSRDITIGLLSVTKPYTEAPTNSSKSRNTPSQIFNDVVEAVDCTDEMKRLHLHEKSIVYEDVVGCGEFGIVHKAKLLPAKRSGSQQTVAVKKARNFRDEQQKTLIECEFKLLVRLTGNANVISVIGIVSTITEIALVLEYCDGGSLKAFLDTKRFKLVSNISNETCDNHQIDTSICSQLISFAHQIANGMEFISLKHCVHRDLAARNVLLCNKQTVAKITDFGLAKDIYQSEVYLVTTNKKIPWAWSAPEVLLNGAYFFESDVWSFGVLFWELMSLGGKPYIANSTNISEFVEALETGRRLDKPVLADENHYELMKSCWQWSPVTRPTFAEIKAKLENNDYLLPDTF